MIPRPYTERIERIELALEVAGGDTANVANEVAIDVIGMGLVLSERAVEVDLINPHRPELANEDFSLIYEVIAPVVIPLIRTILRPQTSEEARRSENVASWSPGGRRPRSSKGGMDIERE